jgi:hypothetical protein
MKCIDFEASVVDLLNGLLEEPERGEALEHAHRCKKCEAILFEQQRLSLELQALAANESQGQAPPELEQRLVAAFKAHSNEVKASSFQASFSFFALWRFIAGEKKWKYATVAVSLVFCLFVSWNLWHRPPSNSNALATMPLKLDTPAPIVEMRRAMMPQVKSEGIPDVHPIRRSTRAKLPPQIEWVTAEAATDFYAIPYVEPFKLNDRVRVVRIQAPYSTLADYGLPVYSDQALRSVQADVMVGDDNVARAIRFIQQWRLPRTQSHNSFIKTDY